MKKGNMMLVIRLYCWMFLGHLLTFWKMYPQAFIWGVLTAFNDLPMMLRIPEPTRRKAVKAAVKWFEENEDKEYPSYPKFVMNRLRLLASSADDACADE